MIMQDLQSPGAPRVPQAPPSSRWRPGPLIIGAAAVHAAAAAAVLADSATMPWAVGGVIGSHLALAGAGLWPRSTLLGPNLLRLPPSASDCVALTFDDGPHPELTPRVLDLLDRHGARATFFCIGDRAQQYPGLVLEIVRRGHDVENHSMRHPLLFSTYGPRRIYKEIIAAQNVLTAITGLAPRYFRAPAGLRNPWLDPILCKLGLQLATWTRRGFDTRDGDRAARIAQTLTGKLAGRDILLLHDGHAGRGPDGRPHLLTVLPAVLAATQRAGLRCVTLRAGTATN